MVGRSRTVVDHVDAVLLHAVLLVDVPRTESADRGHPERLASGIGKALAVVPGHVVRQPLRVVFEIQVVLDDNLGHVRHPAGKSVRRNEKFGPHLSQQPGNSAVKPEVLQERPARRRPQPMAVHIVPGEQILRRSAVEQQVELVLRMGRSDALHRLQREPADAVQSTRNHQPGIERHHRHATKLQPAWQGKAGLRAYCGGFSLRFGGTPVHLARRT